MAQKRAYTKSWLQLEQDLGARPVLKGTSEELRAQFAALGPLLASQYPPPSAAVQVHEHDIGGIRARVYFPTVSHDAPLPVGIYAHGGGYVLGSLDSEDPFCRAVVEHAKTIIVSIDYRLAPENKAPAQLEDMLSGFQWAYENATSFNGNPDRLYTIGQSAGAGLALSVARKVALGLTPLPPAAIKGVFAMSAIAFHPQNVPEKFKSEYTSYEENAENVPIIDRTSMEQFFDITQIAPDDKDYFVGIDLDSHKSFPPTYLCTCEFDPLRDDGTLMVKLLQKAGVPVKHDHYDGLPHVFWLFPLLEETQVLMKNTYAGLGWLIDQM